MIGQQLHATSGVGGDPADGGLLVALAQEAFSRRIEDGCLVIDAYHQLWRIERSFRMSKHDLQARPIYHHTRDSIEAHVTIVFGARTVSRRTEHQTGWSVKNFVRTARRYPTVTIHAGRQTLTAAESSVLVVGPILAL